MLEATHSISKPSLFPLSLFLPPKQIPHITMVIKSSTSNKKPSHHRRTSSFSDHLLLTPSMKDFATCFSDHAVRVSDATCSANTTLKPTSAKPSSNTTMKDLTSCFSEHSIRIPDASCSGSSNSSGGLVTIGIDQCNASSSSALTAVTCIYRSRLSTSKDFIIRVTWSKSPAGGTMLSFGVDNTVASHQLQLKKKKGSRSYVAGSTIVGVYWDFSAAKFASGPEPVEDFYVVVIVNAEFALLLGDMCEEYIKKFEEKMLTGEFTMISRKEQVLGHSQYSTKARFCDSGEDHEITICCKVADHRNGWDSELSVCVDNKKMVSVKSLKWNFRGNQTIFVDGLPVDMMWDVHDWCFGSPNGCAVFMFRTRSALESRLWLEEEKLSKEKGMSGFVLLVQAFRA